MPITITVTGNLLTLADAGETAKVVCTLVAPNITPFVPRIANTGIIVQPVQQTGIAGTSFSFVLVSPNHIVPNGSPNQLFHVFQFFNHVGKLTASAMYDLSAVVDGMSVDISTLTPIGEPVPPYTPPPPQAVLLNPTGLQSILTYPLAVAILESESGNQSLSGFLRLSHGDAIGWRNNANSGDLSLGVNANDQLTFNGIPITAPGVINAKNFGAKGDGFAAPLNGSMTAGSATLTLTTTIQNGHGVSGFTPAMVGYDAVVPFAAAGSQDLYAQIATYISPTQVALSVSATNSVHTVDVFWAPHGRDDLAALQAAANAAAASGALLYIPSGVYFISGSLTNSTLLEGIIGDGRQATWLVSNSASNTSPAMVLTDVPYGFKLSGIGFKGRGQVVTSGTENGVEFRLTQNNGVVITEIDDLRTLDYPGHGLYIQEPIVSTISNCIFDDVGNTGLYIDVGPSGFGGTSVTVRGCYSFDNDQAYFFNNLAYSSVIGCAADSNNTNYWAVNCASLSFINCGSEVALGTGTIGYIISGGVNNSVNNCYWTKVPHTDGVGVAVTNSAVSTIIDGFRSNQPSITPLVDVSIGVGCTNTIVRNLTSTATTPVSDSGTNTYQQTGGALTVTSITTSGEIKPNPDLSVNLGDTTHKWANIYSGNLYAYTNFGIRAGGTIGFAPSTDPTAAPDTSITRDSAGTVDFNGATSGDQQGTIVFKEAQASRFKARKASAIVIGDFVPDANWGASTTVALINTSSRDHGGQISIHCNGTVVANPTVTFTFHDGSWGTPPAVVVCRGDTHAPTTGYWDVETVTATTVLFRFVGTPVSGTNYTLNWIAIGT